MACYADDTLVLAGGKGKGKALIRGEVAVHNVVRLISDAGLQVAARKTEAVFFHGRDTGPPPLGLSFVMHAARIKVQSRMNYLRLILDGR